MEKYTGFSVETEAKAIQARMLRQAELQRQAGLAVEVDGLTVRRRSSLKIGQRLDWLYLKFTGRTARKAV